MRNTTEAAEHLARADGDRLELIAAHDPDMIRDVAAALISDRALLLEVSDHDRRTGDLTVALASRVHAAAEEGPCQSEWRTFDALPDVGHKFIALYSDGSGAVMFWRHDDGFIDQDGEDHAALNWRKDYDRWAYLPDLEFWCENCPEDPMTLRLPDAPVSPKDGTAERQPEPRDAPNSNPHLTTGGE